MTAAVRGARMRSISRTCRRSGVNARGCCARNGKLCVNAPIMPIPEKKIRQDTRHLKDIGGDIKQVILAETDLRLFSIFIWQKQTSKLMFGRYPRPGNILEYNITEFIHVYVKPGKPPKFDDLVKVATIWAKPARAACVAAGSVARVTGNDEPLKRISVAITSVEATDLLDDHLRAA
jgi:hypothetical protein